MKTKKTIEELESVNEFYMTAAEINAVTGDDPQALRMKARQRPDLVPFDFVISGNRVKFIRSSFCKWYRSNL